MKRGLKFRASVLEQGRPIMQQVEPAGNGMSLSLEITDPRPWSPADPFLYDLEFEVLDGEKQFEELP